jgi:lysine/ornithine N-monooxygenase
MSGLPGMRLPRDAPLFVPRAQFVDYLERYARHFRLPVRTGACAERVERLASGWRVHLQGNETIDARVLVVATGIASRPREPAIPGRAEFERGGGRVFHSVQYREPSALLGKRVLVVGVGNSGGEIASEIARAGPQTSVTIAVRSGANVVPREIAGIPIQYLARVMRQLPRRVREVIVLAMRRVVEKRRGPPVLPRPAHGPLDAIPLIGFHLVDAIREGLVTVRGGVERLTMRGAHFADGKTPDELPFDVVILATGFAPALEPLGQLVRVDQKGFALRRDRVASADHEDLYFVGHNYDSTGGLFNIKRDAIEVAKRVVRSRAHRPITEHSQNAYQTLTHP